MKFTRLVASNFSIPYIRKLESALLRAGITPKIYSTFEEE